MSEKIEFPKWKYHADAEPLLVQSEAQELAIGSGWFDSPAEAEAAAPKKPIRKVKP